MEVILFKITPQNYKKKQCAFADFIIDFGTAKIKVKGCWVMLNKSGFYSLRLPTIPRLDGEPSSPLCWPVKEQYNEFMEKAKKQIMDIYPAHKWDKGMWCATLIAGMPVKPTSNLPEMDDKTFKGFQPKNRNKPFNGRLKPISEVLGKKTQAKGSFVRPF